jgi:hypothetical protein
MRSRSGSRNSPYFRRLEENIEHNNANVTGQTLSAVGGRDISMLTALVVDGKSYLVSVTYVLCRCYICVFLRRQL